MKILKFFIILFGWVSLMHTHINAQVLSKAVDVEMEIVFNGVVLDHDDFDPPTIPCPPVCDPPTGHDYDSGFGGSQMRTEGLTVDMSSTPIEIDVVLVFMIYDFYSGSIIGEHESGSPTTSHTFPLTINGDSGDKFYLECGYRLNNDSPYKRDSGCTVIIEPFGMSPSDEVPSWVN